ncbi:MULTISPECIES: hypothetical protein [Streptomyces]|uniref:hypothetical protein n=1 Tax=Streptomyces TaxID=1883 RepID=UPI0018D90F09|nr:MULTISPECIES: hypothetical protein [Streptomyces]
MECGPRKSARSPASWNCRTLCTDDGSLTVQVRYAGALEWYTVRGGHTRLHDPRDHSPVHELLVNVLHYPGS